MFVKCKEDKTYDYPATWPTCVDKLDCATPVLDEDTMSYDWTDSVGLTPPFTIE